MRSLTCLNNLTRQGFRVALAALLTLSSPVMGGITPSVRSWRRPRPLSLFAKRTQMQLKSKMKPLPDALRPFDARMIDVGDGHWIYVEEVGTKGGRPIVFLHGGPGSGSQHVHRTLFDPARDHVFLLDQRGAGRSHPYLSLTANTTSHLVGDLEIIREHFGIAKWLVAGGSWGSTLGLAYAEKHPDRVSGLVLRAIFLGTDREVAWAFIDGPKIFRPELFEAFRDRLPAAERADPLAAYLARLGDPDPAVHAPGAHAWFVYERALSELAPRNVRSPATFAKVPACRRRRSSKRTTSGTTSSCSRARSWPMPTALRAFAVRSCKAATIFYARLKRLRADSGLAGRAARNHR